MLNNPAALDAFTVEHAQAQVVQAFYDFGAENLEGRGVAFRFPTRLALDMARLDMANVIQYPQHNINWAFYTGETAAAGRGQLASPPTIDSFLINEVKEGSGPQERGAVCMTSPFNFFMFQ